MERHGFVTGGTWCVDYNMVLAAWPREETANRILATTRQGGGSGCNFAVDMRRLAPEIPVWTIGLCGDDADGALLRAIAQENGITARFHVDPGIQTHRTFAFTAQDNGSRTHLFEAESSDHLTPDHFDFADIPARILHLGLPGTHAVMDAPWDQDANGWVTVLRRARAAGLRTNLELMTIDRAQLRALVLPCLPHLDYLVVNDAEIGALAGIDTLPQGRTDPGRVVAAARDVLERGAMSLVAVHFPGGALAVERGGTVHAQSSAKVPQDTVKGTNGAGDAFAAGFFCALHRGQPVADCLRLAHASAAASLRSVDTYGAVESAETCLALADEYGWRAPLRIEDELAG
ncbi:carbohydrate kinase family protein [Paracoccus laeviglucosivorans]|uniref:Sugar or nucleoside kinase, ribokinase family n=1 Tax=Paracoccus laeviglucosivorans TaxID=1197861 RepID=A0A521F0P7_9RHOB|nr:carbohydrate kinase family protein [Paracoccus laeviglucosivorans]SMO89768.1 Sugar or nucleoside kinase, ribokinase family [Paracoccus laeviglucosivorans]